MKRSFLAACTLGLFAEVAKSGDLAHTQGSYTLTVTDPATKKPIHDKGSYVTVLQKAGGRCLESGFRHRLVWDAAGSRAPA